MANKPPAIISLEEFDESINMIVYGNSGVGKTVFGGTCPKALFLAMEPGTISAKRQGSDAELWPVNTWQDLQEAYDWLEENPDAYDWIIVDTATKMQELCMRGILDAAQAENKSRDPDIPAIQDWQKYYNMFRRFVLAFNSLPVNVLWLAQPMMKEDEEGNTIVLPEIAGPSHSPLRESQAFCAAASVVAYLQITAQGKGEAVTSVTRSLLFHEVPPYFAKDRYGVFPRWVRVSEEDGDGNTKQLTSMASVQKAIENSGSKAPAKKAPAKAAAAPAGAVRRRPTR